MPWGCGRSSDSYSPHPPPPPQSGQDLSYTVPRDMIHTTPPRLLHPTQQRLCAAFKHFHRQHAPRNALAHRACARRAPARLRASCRAAVRWTEEYN